MRRPDVDGTTLVETKLGTTGACTQMPAFVAHPEYADAKEAPTWERNVLVCMLN